MIRVFKFDYNSEDDLYANTYVIADENKDAVVIDPSIDNDKLILFLKKNSLSPKAVLLTHGHFDHIQGVKFLVDEYGIPIYLHQNEIKTVDNPKLNCSFFSNKEVALNLEYHTIKNGDILNLLANEEIEVIYTPFHTDGSVCYFLRNSKKLFSGDTLFKGSVGRDDLATSQPERRKESIEKIKMLPDEIVVYPGHGMNTTIGEEKTLNVFFK